MGIILRPRSGRPFLTFDELITKLRDADVNVELDRERAKIGVIEQIIFAYRPYLDGKPINFDVVDKFFQEYSSACDVTIDHETLDEGLITTFSAEEPLWFGEVYPTDTDPASRFVMYLASVLDYEAEGE